MAGLEKIGIVGLGKMGSAVAERLVSSGERVSGWTSNFDARHSHLDTRIERSNSLLTLAENVDVILLSLPDGEAVRAVLTELSDIGLDGKLIVDCSTIGPEILRTFAANRSDDLIGLIDAPISGGPEKVREGRAGLYMGGTPHDVARFMPIAKYLSNRIHHVGDLGAGYAAKIANNMMLAGYWQCLKETLDVAYENGLAAEQILKILETSPAANGSLTPKIPTILGTSNAVGFSASGIMSDLKLFVENAERNNVPVPSIKAALASFSEFASKNPDSDFVAMLYEACVKGK